MDNKTFYNNIASHLGEDGTKTHKWYGMGGTWHSGEVFVKVNDAWTSGTLYKKVNGNWVQ